jgi:DNA (cytosine-5)-methyltransferase 1
LFLNNPLCPLYPTDVPLELTVFPLLYGKNAPGKLPNGKEHFNGYSPKFQERDEGDVTGKSFKRLHRYRFSPTVWYGNQEVHLHPSEPRRLSVREALRIQTVPDEYVLPPEESLSSKFKLIGNGVPCLMA